jgi:ubiquinone/menaquinone biosynthesis C-methylase UbiE
VALREAARVLRRGGRVIVVEDNERFGATDKGRPQTVLREWLERAGMECRKMKHVEVDSSRLLFALAER